MDGILDDNGSSLLNDSMPLALVSKVGAPCGVFLTSLMYPSSYAFQAQDHVLFGMQTLALMRIPMQMNVIEVWVSPLEVQCHMT